MERKDDFDMDGIGEDLFFLSNGHISPVYYSVLARSGYFPVEELNTFRLINSRLQGHPTTHEGLPGIRIASGSLGQGMSVAIGAAQAKKLNNDDHLVHSLQKQIDGATDDVLPMGDLKAKFEAFGWDVMEIKEGNDITAVVNGLKEAKTRAGKGKPVCILLYTMMGNGVDFMMHTHAWHGKAPNDEQLEAALAQNPETLGDY